MVLMLISVSAVVGTPGLSSIDDYFLPKHLKPFFSNSVIEKKRISINLQ